MKNGDETHHRRPGGVRRPPRFPTLLSSLHIKAFNIGLGGGPGRGDMKSAIHKLSENKNFAQISTNTGNHGPFLGIMPVVHAQGATPSFGSATYTREVAENTAAGENVGDPVTATGGTGALTYTLGGTDAAASFSGQQVTNDTQAADQLTASAAAVPESHDGHFIFEVRLSERPRKPFSYKLMRDHAFTVTGGQVTKARRLEEGKNLEWEIHVTPDGDGAVTIVLPVTTDCTAQGAICTQDRRPLSNRLEVTVPGTGG